MRAFSGEGRRSQGGNDYQPAEFHCGMKRLKCGSWSMHRRIRPYRNRKQKNAHDADNRDDGKLVAEQWRIHRFEWRCEYLIDSMRHGASRVARSGTVVSGWKWPKHLLLLCNMNSSLWRPQWPGPMYYLGACHKPPTGLDLESELVGRKR